MAAARAPRRIATSPHSAAGEAIDPALLDGINAAIVELGGSPDPIRRAIAARLREDRGLVVYIAGVANRQGRSFGDEAEAAQRHAAFRELGKTIIASALRTDLLNYQGNNWQRDRGKPNPYSMPDPRFYYFKILTSRDRVPSERWLREILKSNGV